MRKVTLVSCGRPCLTDRFDCFPDVEGTQAGSTVTFAATGLCREPIPDRRGGGGQVRLAKIHPSLCSDATTDRAIRPVSQLIRRVSAA